METITGDRWLTRQELADPVQLAGEDAGPMGYEGHRTTVRKVR
jgi:hypothetical protein